MSGSGERSLDVETLAKMPPWNWPANAGRAIHDRLTGGRNDTPGRRLAAALAGNLVVMNDDLARALVAVVRDSTEDASLRETATISLGSILEEMELRDFDDPLASRPSSETVLRDIRAALAEVYRDAEAPRDVRRRALEASVRADEPWHAGAVRAAYHSDDPKWRLTAVFCMRYVRGFDDEILETLSSEDADLVYEAVRAAGSREVDGAWRRIHALLVDDDTDKPTLLAAIEAAGSVSPDPDELAEALADLIDSDDEEIVQAAFEAMEEAEPLDDVDESDVDVW